MFAKSLIVLSIILTYSHAAWDVTCDFDLEGIEEIIEYLPTECKRIYKAGPNSELYQASLGESKKFAEYNEKLEQYERKASSTAPNEIPKEDTALRYNIYHSALLYTCALDIGNRTDLVTDHVKTNEYYSCLSHKRDQMLDFIPK